MESAILKGDRLIVDKTAYGIRLPITLITIPFTFDKFLGFKSYSGLIRFPYKRIFSKNINKNDVVLFNNPLETEKPIDKRSLCLSRCIGNPGDTIKVENNDMFINGNKYLPSPDMLMSYRYKYEYEDTIVSVMKLFNIPVRNISQDLNWKYTSLNSYEIFILNQRLPNSYLCDISESDSTSYLVIIPEKGKRIKINAFTISLYGNIISQENKGEVSFQQDKLLIGDSLSDTYQFTENYYWFISDNLHEAVDSRQIGFISEKYIIGKASYIWLSTAGGEFSRERSFKSIN